MATQMYVALASGLVLQSFMASWPWPQGRIAPLDPSNYMTQRLIGDGSIALAPDGSVDNTTPPHVLRGQPGLHLGVSN